MPDPTLADPLLRFAGRLHPILVHFPVALLIAAALFETLRLIRRKPDPSPSAISCVVLGALGAAVAAFSGWMNADFETHSETVANTIFWHRWLGVAIAVLGVVLVITALTAKYLKNPPLQRIYALLLLATAAMTAFTGHLGGTLVYGDAYLFEVFRSSNSTVDRASGPDRGRSNVIASRPPPPGATLTINFARDIQPILNRNCIDCHGPTKQKANLRLDHPSHILAHISDVTVVLPTSPEQSEIIARLSLKKGDEGRMPPRGDPLPAEQVNLIRQWITEGAYWTDASPTTPTPAPTPEPAPPTPLAPPLATPLPAPQWDAAHLTAIEAIRAIGGRVEPVAVESTDLDINLSVAGAKATDAVLPALESLAARTVSLNLARTGITDAAAPFLAKLTSLRRLHLEETSITDTTLAALAPLTKLQYLNLTKTKVTDAGLARLAPLTSLRNLYVADTSVTLDGAIKLQEALPTLDVEIGIPKQ